MARNIATGHGEKLATGACFLLVTLVPGQGVRDVSLHVGVSRCFSSCWGVAMFLFGNCWGHPGDVHSVSLN